MGNRKNKCFSAESNALSLFSLMGLMHQMQSHWKSMYMYVCFSAAESIIVSVCGFYFIVCVAVAKHLASKRLSEQSDELGVCGHAFNELRTRPELKERRRKSSGGRRERKMRRISLWNTCFGLVISVPGRGQSTLPAVTSPFSTVCSSEEMSPYECVCFSLSLMSETT